MSQIKPIRPVPTKLEREPLIDAVFEMRFEASAPVSSILPGLIYNALSGEKTIEHMPIMSLPKEVRESDVNLQFAPLVRVSWGAFWIFIGDKNFSVASRLPYTGWTQLREAVLTAFTVVCQSGLISKINRYSTKYVDMIPFEADLPLDETFNFSLSIGGVAAGFKDYQVRADIADGSLRHIVNLVSNATTHLNGEPNQTSGSIIDIDTFENLEGEPPDQFLSLLAERANKAHSANKALFFNCLTDKTLNWLGPVYE